MFINIFTFRRFFRCRILTLTFTCTLASRKFSQAQSVRVANHTPSLLTPKRLQKSFAKSLSFAANLDTTECRSLGQSGKIPILLLSMNPPLAAGFLYFLGLEVHDHYLVVFALKIVFRPIFKYYRRPKSLNLEATAGNR